MRAVGRQGERWPSAGPFLTANRLVVTYTVGR